MERLYASSNLNNITTFSDKNTLFVPLATLSSSIKCLKNDTFTKFYCDSSHINNLNADLFLNLYDILRPSGSIEILNIEEFDENTIRKNLKISGFINLVIDKKRTFAEKLDNVSVAPLKKKNMINNGNSKAEAWKLDNSTNGALLDEDSLLQGEEEIIKFSKPSDCLTKPKACDNCTCGRAEYCYKLIYIRLELGKDDGIKQLEGGQIKSNCGKCYLGDAFRCATCPYLGQPAFEPGDKLVLKSSDQANIGNEREEIKTKSLGNKVLLDI